MVRLGWSMSAWDLMDGGWGGMVPHDSHKRGMGGGIVNRAYLWAENVGMGRGEVYNNSQVAYDKTLTVISSSDKIIFAKCMAS